MSHLGRYRAIAADEKSTDAGGASNDVRVSYVQNDDLKGCQMPFDRAESPRSLKSIEEQLDFIASHIPVAVAHVAQEGTERAIASSTSDTRTSMDG